MQIPAGEFKSKCLKLMDQVRDTHEEIVITKHGLLILNSRQGEIGKPVHCLIGLSGLLKA